MLFDALKIERKVGAQASDEAFVSVIHEMTRRAAACDIPLRETVDRLERASLGHYVYIEHQGERRLVAYSLNELFGADVGVARIQVNYFCSAFLLPEVRGRYSLYRLLGALRLSGGEEVLMMRTQAPFVMSSFLRMCRQQDYRVFTALSAAVPDTVRAVMEARFSQPGFIHRGVYPGRVSPPAEARTPSIARLMSFIEPERGDACVFIAQRLPPVAPIVADPSHTVAGPAEQPTLRPRPAADRIWRRIHG